MAAILFVMRYPLDCWENLKAKFDGQMAAAEALGHEAWFLGYNKAGVWLCRGEERTLVRRAPLGGLPGYSKTLFYVDLMEGLKKAVSLRSFDGVYLRFMRFFFNAPGALARVKASGAKLILEHPTYPFEHGRVMSPLRRPVFWVLDRVFARMEPLLDLYALIGDPCGPELHGVPAINIVNGVDVDRIPPHRNRPTPDIGFLALASMSRWQGYDRLIEALAAYRGDAEITLHMVGGEGDGSLAEWKRLARERGVEDHVRFHGALFGSRLDEVAARCDVGIGGLGLFRKGQFCSMTLKLREYMARGLPFVYAVDDPNVPEEARFCLRVPNDDSPIDMEELVAFARRAKADGEVSGLMRAYAREHMSWQTVLKNVLGKVGIA